MTRRAARTDSNQREIVGALRRLGASVQSLHRVGQGCPDLLIGYRGKNLLAEVKYERGSLTAAEAGWHDAWRGQVAIVRSVDDVVRLLESA